MKSIDDKIFQLLYEEELIDIKGNIINENFITDIEFLIEGELQNTKNYIISQMQPLLKHLLLLKYFDRHDRWMYIKKWKGEALEYLIRIKIENCIKDKYIEEIENDKFVYDKKKVFIIKEKLKEFAFANSQIKRKIIDVNRDYKLNLNRQIKIDEIDNFEFYDNDIEVINNFK